MKKSVLILGFPQDWWFPGGKGYNFPQIQDH